MKTFKELLEEKVVSENIEEIQEMAYTEVQIACDNAERIMKMMDEGIEPESWNYKKITQAADYLTSVYTAMRAKKSEEPDMGFSMYGEETELEEAKRIPDTRYPEYSIERSKEKVTTIKHPKGAPVHYLFLNDEQIGKIKPYSGYIDKKKPGARIVQSRRDATLYTIDFDKEHEPPRNTMRTSAKYGHRNAKDALQYAATYHSIHRKRNEEDELDEVRKRHQYGRGDEKFSELQKRVKNTPAEWTKLATGKDFEIFSAYSGSLKRQRHVVVKNDEIIGSGWTMPSALKDAGLKPRDVKHFSKWVPGHILNTMKESSDVAWKTKRGKWANSLKSGFKSKEDAENHYHRQKEIDRNTKANVSRLKPVDESDTHKTKDGRTAKKGLWYNINKRRKKGLPRKKPGDEGYPETLDI